MGLLRSIRIAPAAVVSLALVACSSTNGADGGTDLGPRDAGATDSGAVDSGGTDAGTTDSGAVDSGDTDAGATDSGAVDSGDADAGAIDAGTADGGPGDAAVGTGTLAIGVDFTVLANCMPIVPADPVIAFWTASFSAATGSTATLVDATLTITGPRTVVQHLTLDVPDVALTSGSASQMQHKTGADVDPGPVCSDLCGAGVTASLDLSFDTADGRLSAHADTSFSCLF